MTRLWSKRGKLKTHELCIFDDGENDSVSVRNTGLNEAMHSSIGPETEARIVYVDGSDFPARLERGFDNDPLVIYDLGLGIAANPIVALERIGDSPRRPIEIHSFENDLSGLKLALENRDHFPFLWRWHEPLSVLLRDGLWVSGSGKTRWELHLGDFRATALPRSRPELIYFDFYSPRSQPELWTERVFSSLRGHCREEAVLLTYSSATAVRSALLLAGFFVGKGAQTSAKFETTIGAPLRTSLIRPLGPEFLEKLGRSAHPSAGAWLKQLQTHPQFVLGA